MQLRAASFYDRAYGAGAGNRTPIPSLENLYTNRCTTPADRLYALYHLPVV